MNDIPDGSGIYRIVCTVNGMFYIGSAINFRKRHQAHFGELRRKTHHNSKLQRAFDKYTESAFIFEIIEFVLPPFLLEREQYHLDKLKPFGKIGFNIDRVAGSRLGHKPSPESLEKMRLSHLGQVSGWKGKKASHETRAKQSTAKKGKPSHWKGKKASPETIAKISDAKRGKSNPHPGVPRTPEVRAKIAAAGLGRKHKPESRAKMSTNMQGNKRGAKDYIVTSPEGIEYAVHDLKAFCQDRGLTPQALGAVARGLRNHHKGWIAIYAPQTS